MPVIYCKKCHKMVTTVAQTEDGIKIGKMSLGKNGTIKGGIIFKCPSGHTIKIDQEGNSKMVNDNFPANG